MDSNHTNQLDQLTQDVINAILQHQHSGSIITVQSSTIGDGRPLRIEPLQKTFTLPELRRLRRQFLQINRLKNERDLSVLGRSFVEYIVLYH
jgi:protein KTI12